MRQRKDVRPATSPRPPHPPRGKTPSDRTASTGRLWLYGRRAVAAALVNPNRRLHRILATKNALAWLASMGVSEPLGAPVDIVRPDHIDRLLHNGAVHQGLAAEADPLPRARLKEVCAPAAARRPVVVLDQVTDPQNIGALFRSATAFGACAMVVQDRRTPPLAGALAKAAAGSIETLPCVPVVNIARALEALADLGYQTVGLSAAAETEIAALSKDEPCALVLGAEGAGLRPLVAKTCRQLARIPIAPAAESLNVSTAAAIALYELTRR
jgi:23S rRNA (guanosine2251-2'-O)-methyltransferase